MRYGGHKWYKYIKKIHIGRINALTMHCQCIAAQVDIRALPALSAQGMPRRFAAIGFVLVLFLLR
jgi:hypothetical protein